MAGMSKDIDDRIVLWISRCALAAVVVLVVVLWAIYK
jgi:hypothetical protein